MRRNPQAGQALFLTAISLVVLVGMLGLGIDVGVLRYEKRLQQTAADAAALAGASNLPVNGAGSLGVVDGAKNASASNGFADTDSGSDCGASASVGTVCVQVNNPPQESATHNGDANYVEVLVSAVHPTYFARIFGKTKATVSARAVATNVDGGPHKPCLLALSASANALVVNGVIRLTACDLIVDGNLQINGQIDADAASSIEVAGRCSGNCRNVVTGVPAVADPLANLSTPPADGCTDDGLLGLLNFLNFCQGTVGVGVDVDFTQLASPGSLYIVPGGLTLGANAVVNAPTETLYVPNGGISFPLVGQATVNANAMVVGQPLTVGANVTLTLGGGESSAIKSAVLVE
ncbi:MAG TPA: pilus assembly protein TadG-related protein [Candidatus Acidoferrales bacterium]|nr:pilus assembly protein TadG-related protein [Candidatus Acidoferrales bacterium]